jgi:hypothetical protein
MNQHHRPIWVSIALWGLSGRASALAFCLISLVLGIAIGLGGFWDRRLFLGFLMLLAALWYWLAIRWMDRNSRW